MLSSVENLICFYAFFRIVSFYVKSSGVTIKAHVVRCAFAELVARTITIFIAHLLFSKQIVMPRFYRALSHCCNSFLVKSPGVTSKAHVVRWVLA